MGRTATGPDHHHGSRDGAWPAEHKDALSPALHAFLSEKARIDGTAYLAVLWIARARIVRLVDEMAPFDATLTLSAHG